MTPARSLLDGADLAVLRARAGQLGQTTGLVLACLIDGHALEQDPDDPGWPDRDRLVVGGESAGVLARSLLDDTVVGAHAEALALAVGLAEASRADGGIFRVFCLLDGAACAHGQTWEAARTAILMATETLTAVVVDGDESVFQGWAIRHAGAEPSEVLAGLDHLLDDPGGPAALMVG